MTTLEILEAAERLLRERGTCKGWYARDEHGNGVAYDLLAARTFCPAGALLRAAGGIGDPALRLYYTDELKAALRALECSTRGEAVAQWWDRPETTEADLWAAFARAKEAIRV